MTSGVTLHSLRSDPATHINLTRLGRAGKTDSDKNASMKPPQKTQEQDNTNANMGPPQS